MLFDADARPRGSTRQTEVATKLAAAASAPRAATTETARTKMLHVIFGLNPWISMWTRPRATVRALVEHDPHYFVLSLAALTGVGQMLERASVRNVPLIVLFGVALVVGPLLGILGLYVGAALVRWTGRWLGGSGTAEHLRTALAWGGCLPRVARLVLRIVAFALVGGELFTSNTPRADTSVGLWLVMPAYAVISFVLAAWALVLVLKAVAEVQGFSAWRALGNGLLAAAVILVPLLAIGAVAALMRAAL